MRFLHLTDQDRQTILVAPESIIAILPASRYVPAEGNKPDILMKGASLELFSGTPIWVAHTPDEVETLIEVDQAMYDVDLDDETQEESWES
jgi:hypothetical protein